MQDVTFASGHRDLTGRVFGLSGGDGGRGRGRGVVFIHGQGSSQVGYEHRARLVSERLNAICLTFDLSGHGAAAADFNRYSVFDHLDDVLAAFDYLASRARVDPMRVGVCGASYGGYLAALLTAHRHIKRLLLRAPSLAQDIAFPPWQTPHSVPEEVPEPFDSLRLLRHYFGEVLIVESQMDEVIPASHIDAYVAACSHAEREVIPDAMHALREPRWDEIFIDKIVRWFTLL